MKDSFVPMSYKQLTVSVGGPSQRTTMLLLGSGLIGLSGFRRKCRKKR
jgi:hypothetical protein